MAYKKDKQLLHFLHLSFFLINLKRFVSQQKTKTNLQFLYFKNLTLKLTFTNSVQIQKCQEEYIFEINSDLKII
jgi:hypothetical protein